MIGFQHSGWLKVYINKNTELRNKATKAKNKFEKDFFKLMNNSLFGKTMENIKKHKDIRLVTKETRYKKLVMKANFKDGRKFSYGHKNGKEKDQDDKASVLWSNHTES